MRFERLHLVAFALAVVVAASGALAARAQTTAVVQGTLASITATSAEVTTSSGKQTVIINGNTRVTRSLSTTLADIKVGSFLGVAASKGPNGKLTAVSINILDAIKDIARKGQFPMASGNIMTNADVTSVVTGTSGRTIRMTYEGKTATIAIPPNTPIHRIAVGKLTDLKAGQRVIVRGAAAANGGVTASSISIE
jgi:hypothetical protein